MVWWPRVTEAATKQKRDEVAWGRRKPQNKDDIRPGKREHSPRVSWRTRNPAGFYPEDWDEFQQEEDEWQMPDKWQRISQLVFCPWCLEINPDVIGCISSSCTQHQGGGCSLCGAKARLGERGDKRSMKNCPSTWQGGEDYQVDSKLYLAEEEMNRLFYDDRLIIIWSQWPPNSI